jgi:hypothetical protein
LEKTLSGASFAKTATRNGPAWRPLGFLFAALLCGGCGIAGSADSSAAIVSGLPRCDSSLLHPRMTVDATSSMPGKLIVYVDGVMACVDDASRVDQILSQVEGNTPPAAHPAAPANPATPN